MPTSRRFSLGLALAAALVGPGAASAQGPLFFVPMTPCRVVDTREPTFAPALAPSTTRGFQVKGICGVPDSAAAVAVTATVAAPTGPGNIRLYPANLGSPPLVSTLNFSGNDAEVSNGAIVTLAPTPANPDVSVQAVLLGGTGEVHFILDVVGYFAPGT